MQCRSRQPPFYRTLHAQPQTPTPGPTSPAVTHVADSAQGTEVVQGADAAPLVHGVDVVRLPSVALRRLRHQPLCSCPVALVGRQAGPQQLQGSFPLLLPGGGAPAWLEAGG